LLFIWGLNAVGACSPRLERTDASPGAGASDSGGSGGMTLGWGPASEESNRLGEGCSMTFPLAQGEGGAAGMAGAEAGTGAGSSSASDCRCTRRPGDGNSFDCPFGEAVTVAREIGPEGGTVELDRTVSTAGVTVSVTIPRGALSEATTIRITETSIPPPAGILDWSPLYHFEPEDLTFLTPVQVRIPWRAGNGLVPTELALYWSTEPGGSCEMTPLADSYVNAGFNQGTLKHFGWGIVGVARPQGSSCP
jgi:hypothetical protein